jgi:hypothetical protein
LPLTTLVRLERGVELFLQGFVEAVASVGWEVDRFGVAEDFDGVLDLAEDNRAVGAALQMFFQFGAE